MIKIIHHGTGNINSIANMLQKIGVDHSIISSASDLSENDKLILPGVGSFDRAVKNIKTNGIFYELKENFFKKNYKILGICLGMQLLCKGSEEGVEDGLDFFNVTCKKFPTKNNKSPTLIGWTGIEKTSNNLIFDDIDAEDRFYFLHSYYVDINSNYTLSISRNNGLKYSSIIYKKNIYGIQFHPERSHNFGLKILNNFSKY